MKEKVLITGGNGFLALHLIQQLLQAGYPVRATLRHLNQGDGVRAALAAQHTPNLDDLSFVEADLTSDAGWSAAMAGITHVLSVAAPVFVNGETTTAAMTNTATEGTQRILRAAAASSVQRVVMTANLGAVGFSNHDRNRLTTEADWTNPKESGLSAYEASKLNAERAAWAEAQALGLEFATVNAGAMLGPAIGDHVSGSFGLVRQLLDGSMTRVPNIAFNIAPVEDVAAIHIRALFAPKAAGQRFLAVADDVLTLPEIVDLIRTQRPALAATLPTKRLPNWLVYAAAPFNATAREGRLLLSINHNVSNQKAKSLLGWTPTQTAANAVLAAVDQLSSM
jgi:nucleoside-diphosphate-sugar epimerase